MTEAPSVTIGFVPRDRFCLASRALERLLDRTAKPFHLIVVDADMPAVFRDPLERLLEGMPDAMILHAGDAVSSNAAGPVYCHLDSPLSQSGTSALPERLRSRSSASTDASHRSLLYKVRPPVPFHPLSKATSSVDLRRFSFEALTSPASACPDGSLTCREK